jgi:hypothetical protein
MRRDDTALRLVPVLPTRARTPRGDDVDIPLVQSDDGWVVRIEHDDSDGRRVNTSPLLVRWNPLPAVTSSLLGESLTGSRS